MSILGQTKQVGEPSLYSWQQSQPYLEKATALGDLLMKADILFNDFNEDVIIYLQNNTRLGAKQFMSSISEFVLTLEQDLPRLKVAISAFSQVPVPPSLTVGHSLFRQGLIAKEAAWEQLSKGLHVSDPSLIDRALVSSGYRHYNNSCKLLCRAFSEFKQEMQVMGAWLNAFHRQ